MPMMDLDGLRSMTISQRIGISQKEFGRVFSFVDFGNVDYWFEEDRSGVDGVALAANQKLVIDLQKLFDFAGAFSEKTKIYYGHDPQLKKSMGFLFIIKKIFGGNNVETKAIQKIKHYPNAGELSINTRPTGCDARGEFIRILKCNFDVEICVDAIRLLDKYDTCCLFSSDADFRRLFDYLKGKGKKIILIKGGYAQYDLKKLADKVINAQDIKQYIAQIKAKI